MWRTCREPRHTPLRSHLRTNFPLVSGLGVGEGVGIGEVRSSEMRGCPSPSMLWGGGSGPRLPSMPFTTKGYFSFFLSFLSFFYVLCHCCSLLRELGSNQCPWFFMFVVLLHSCGIPSILIGYHSQPQLAEGACGLHLVNEAEPPPLSQHPHPPTRFLPSAAHTHRSLGSRLRHSCSETWDASLGIVGFLRRISAHFPSFRRPRS